MKIKVRPEDFVVREEADLPLKREGRYGVYLLEKRWFNTVDLLIRLSRRLGIPFRHLSYGGKKDRYALTTQYITIEGMEAGGLQEESYSLTFVGRMDRPMGPDLIKGNRFRVVIRDLSQGEVERLVEEVPLVREYGFVNYFDDQRFGSYSPDQGFIAEKIIKRHYRGALKIYLTATHPGDRRQEKERKRFFYEHWGEWERCLERSRTSYERRAFMALLKGGPSVYVDLLKAIPREELSLFFSAFQSYLWNLLAERLIRATVREGLLRYRGHHWYYYFYRRLGQERDYLLSLLLPTPSSRARMPDGLTDRLYMEVLEERGLKPSSFNLKRIRTAFFKSSPRRLVLIPEDLEVETGDDELYSGRRKLTLAFFLPRGGYGTMLIKRLMAGAGSG